MRTSDEREIVQLFTFPIAGENPLAGDARQWIAGHLLDMGGEDDPWDEATAERHAYDLDAEQTRIYLDLTYPGGAAAFVQDFIA